LQRHWPWSKSRV